MLADFARIVTLDPAIKPIALHTVAFHAEHLPWFLSACILLAAAFYCFSWLLFFINSDKHEAGYSCI